MRQMLFAGLLTGLLACTGCFTNWRGEPELKTPSVVAAASKAPPVVRPEQITPENGHQICEAAPKQSSTLGISATNADIPLKDPHGRGWHSHVAGRPPSGERRRPAFFCAHAEAIGVRPSTRGRTMHLQQKQGTRPRHCLTHPTLLQ